MIATLTNSNRDLVASIVVPHTEDDEMPAVVRWGDRIFIQVEGSTTYAEALSVVVVKEGGFVA